MEPGELHSHKCGWDPLYPDRHGKGCGHVFVHELPRVEVSTEVYDHGHLCPSCKAGPWRGVWMPEVETVWAELSEADRAAIQEEVRKEEAIKSFLAFVFRRVLR
jgi:hypothetical protein